jgi:hypothetical protein
MAGEFKGGGHLRDAYGREVFTIATLNDPLDPNDVQATGIICRSLYAIVYLGANTTMTVSNMAAGEASSAFLEIQQVGGPWTFSIKGTVKTQGATGFGISTSANKLDMLTLWTPDGSAVRAKVELDYR